MNHFRVGAFTFVIALIAAAGLVAPARADDRSVCFDQNAALDDGIAACGRLIDAGKTKGNDLASVYGWRASRRLRQNDPDRAIADLDQAIRLDPKDAVAYSRRGYVRDVKGDLDGAIADYDQAIRLDPKLANTYLSRGQLSTLKGDYDRAIADFGEAIRLAPGAFNFFERGAAYLYKPDLDRALADFAEALRLDPGTIDAYAGRCVVLKRRSDLDAAISDCNQAVQLGANSPYAYTSRCGAWLAKGDLVAAAADCERALALNPDYTGGYVNRGLVFERKGESARAAAEFQMALDKPAKYLSSRWFQAVAREHLAALSAPTASSATATPPAAPAARAQASAPAPAVATAAPERRVALVIGNSNYVSFPKIPNPRNDATDLAAELKILGFDVLLGTDLGRSDMEDIFIRFAKKVRESDVAVVFYAGHGLQYQGINYLAPIDAQIDDETDLRKLTNLQNVIDDLQTAGKVRILIVDACRDNEVMKRLASRLPKSRAASLTRGLAAVSGADGTLIAFATQPNRVAADGAGRNSPFTQALLKDLPTPGLELRTLMTRVRAEVVAATGGAQRPEVWDSLVGEFDFKAAAQ